MVKFEEMENQIRNAEAELAEAEKSGASAKRCLDLGRQVRRLRRELRTARRYYQDAAKRQRTTDDREYQATRGQTIATLRKKAGDERCHCRSMEKEPTRRECGQCKLEWLEAEVDE